MTISACQEEPKMDESLEGDIDEQVAAQEVAASKVPDVEVNLINDEGVEVGMAMIKEVAKGVEITVKASHLPEGLHGFHVHEVGVCDAPTFETAGGHFNPTEAAHGFDHEGGPHAGDLRNIEVSADGTVEATFLNEMVTLQKGKPNSLYNENGTSLIIHADPDDYVSQPAGNAGERIVCGVISDKVRE